MNKNYLQVISIVFLSILIGLLSGVVSILFHFIVNSFVDIVGELYIDMPIYIFIIPLAASVIIGIVRQYLLHGQNQGFSVAQVMYEIEHINYLVMKPLDVLYKLLGTILSLISGFCVGRQGPMVHIGGAIGSNIANYFKKNEDDTRVLIGCGVAGCLAGSFNVPIFATLFVVEILFKKRYFDMISTILLSALSSTLLVKLINSGNPFDKYIEIFDYDMSEITNFLILGIIIGVISIGYTFTLRKTKQLFDLAKLSYITKSIIGGLIISLSLMYLSNIYSYNINPLEIITSSRSISLLMITIITYVILTAVSVGSGSMGGIFTPGLFIGASSGLLIAKVFHSLNISMLNQKTYAVVGMAAMYSGFANAPLSGALLIIEITGQYHLIVPAFVATLSSSLITDIIYKDSIYHLNLNDLILIES